MRRACWGMRRTTLMERMRKSDFTRAASGLPPVGRRTLMSASSATPHGKGRHCPSGFGRPPSPPVPGHPGRRRDVARLESYSAVPLSR